MSEKRSPASPPDVVFPGRLDLKKAFRVYVAGRNWNIDPEEKSAGVPSTPASESVPSTPPPTVGESQPASVSVPARGSLRYDRNAGTWRDRTVGGSGDG